MTAESDRPARPVEDNVGLIRQLLNDARAECYRGCAVNITALSENGKEHEVVGSVDRVDLGEEIIYINEAQAIESVPFNRIINYGWQ